MKITIILPGPSGAAINKARRCGCRGRTPYSYPTEEHDAWRKEAISRVQAAVATNMWATVTGPVYVTIVSFWPRKIASGPMMGYAMGDDDAPVKAVFDALAAGGAIADDKQVVRHSCSKSVDKEWPRIEVTVGTL